MRRSVVNMTVTLALALAPAAVFAQTPAGGTAARRAAPGRRSTASRRPQRSRRRKSHGWH